MCWEWPRQGQGESMSELPLESRDEWFRVTRAIPEFTAFAGDYLKLGSRENPGIFLYRNLAGIIPTDVRTLMKVFGGTALVAYARVGEPSAAPRLALSTTDGPAAKCRGRKKPRLKLVRRSEP